MVFTVLAVAGLCHLVQFPVAETIYVYFAAPLGILALLAVFSCQSRTANLPFVVGIVFYLVFTVVWINRSIHLGLPYPPYVRDDQIERLNMDRAGGVRVRAADKEQYEELIRLLPALSSGKYIFATLIVRRSISCLVSKTRLGSPTTSSTTLQGVPRASRRSWRGSASTLFLMTRRPSKRGCRRTCSPIWSEYRRGCDTKPGRWR